MQVAYPKATESDIEPGGQPSAFRWVICALLFLATTLCYLNRSVLAVLAADLQKQIGWNNRQFGYINASFTVGYAVGFIIVSWVIDRIGTKYGYALSLLLWSLASASTGLARGVWSFGITRFGLGLFEAGNFPSAARATAEWFPQRGRAAATGIFNAGSNIGLIASAGLVPLITLRWGWPAAFVAVGVLGLAWILLWLPLYSPPEQSRFANAAEVKLIRSDQPAALTSVRMRWRDILPHRQCWTILAGKFLTDPIWYFYNFWAGKFFFDQFHVKLSGLALPLIVVYLIGDVGSIGGGYISSILISRGFSANAGRKIALLICACCALPVGLITLSPNIWIGVILLGIAAGAHQGFSANLLTLPSDLFPRSAVASVSGLAGCAGAIGGGIMQLLAGQFTNAHNDYTIPFAISSVSYLFAVAMIHLLSPKLEPIPAPETEPGWGTVTAIGQQ